MSINPMRFSFDIELLRLSRNQVIDHEQNYCTENRCDKARRLALGIEAHKLPDERCSERTPDAQDRREPEAGGSGARGDGLCDQSGYEPDQNSPNPMHHRDLLRVWSG